MDFSISACPLFGVQFNDNPKNKTLAFNNKTITCYRFILPCKKKKATMIFLSLWLLSFYDKPKTPCFSAFLQYKRTQRLYHSLGAFMAKDSTNDTMHPMKFKRPKRCKMHPFGLLFYFSFHHLIFKHGNQFIVLMFKFLLIDYLEQHFKIYISKFLVIIY